MFGGQIVIRQHSTGLGGTEQFHISVETLVRTSFSTIVREGYDLSVMLFDRADRTQLATFGEVRTPSVADLFVATMKGQPQ